MPVAENNLITLNEFKIAMGIPETEENILQDEKYNQAITAASIAVRNFADRAFGLPEKQKTNIYEYDSSGFVDIDDCMAVEEVVFTFGGFKTPIEQFYWRPEPQAGPPYTYLSVPHWAGIYSPEMGFTYNLDVIAKDRGWPGLIPLIEVKGKYGWPNPPGDVKQAAIWTAAKFQEKPDQLVSESIANYSYTAQLRGGGGFGGPPPAIPSDAQDILIAYTRFQI
jgi:hypothetical protein